MKIMDDNEKLVLFFKLVLIINSDSGEEFFCQNY